MIDLIFNDEGDSREIKFVMIYKGKEVIVHIDYTILDDLGQLPGTIPYLERRKKYPSICKEHEKKIIEVAKKIISESSNQNNIRLRSADFFFLKN